VQLHGGRVVPERLDERGLDPLSRFVRRVLLGAEVGEHDHELVAACTGDHVALAHAAAQPGGDLTRRRVPGRGSRGSRRSGALTPPARCSHRPARPQSAGETTG
jgi:hypothetical protein